MTLYKKFSIPSFIATRVPRHWLTFIDEAVAELLLVKNTVYEGQISKGQRNGHGQIVYPNGDVFKGQFKAGERNGAGLCKFAATGSIYKGEWREDKPMGNGMFFTLPNELVEGRFDGYRIIDGQVKILLRNGEFYEGNLRQGQRNATGLHYYINGDFYDGEWQNDKRNGKGRIVAADGSKLSGHFFEDKADGNVEFEDKNGNVFLTAAADSKAQNKTSNASKSIKSKK